MRREADYGTAPPVAPDSNAHTKSVADALRQQRHERLSLFNQPGKFDPKTFAADPEAYLNAVEPGRVFQAAQPGPGVPRITNVSPASQQLRQGQAKKLVVHAAPGAPVTFTSLDLGRFHNLLTSVTVQANERGDAEATFTATPGTIGRVRVLAASPLASGQARFVLNVARPASAGANAVSSAP